MSIIHLASAEPEHILLSRFGRLPVGIVYGSERQSPTPLSSLSLDKVSYDHSRYRQTGPTEEDVTRGLWTRRSGQKALAPVYVLGQHPHPKLCIVR